MSQAGTTMQSVHAAAENREAFPADEYVELPLLLTTWQLAALERAAHCQKLTVGQLLRRLLQTYLAGRTNALPSAERRSGQTP